jgi:L,D-transpeptidase YcbB
MLIICNLAGCRQARTAAPRASTPDVRTALVSVLSGKVPSFVVNDAPGRHLWTATREFYQQRDFDLAWDGASARRDVDELLDALQHADRDALDPARYRAAEVARLRDILARAPSDENGARTAATLDARLTYLYLQYSTDLANGVTGARHGRWKIAASSFDAVASLQQALGRDRAGDTLRELQQRDPQYAALRAALERYREIVKRGGWPTLPATFRLKPGGHSPLVALLAKRLSITGDYTPSGTAGPPSAVYDGWLKEAVQRFQRRLGLTPDGVIGPAVVEQLNVPATERVRQIALNMERWRWLPRDGHSRRIFVNIPEYRLEVQDAGRVPISMRVIVGRKSDPTPAFSGEMTYLVLAPFWNVPADIAEKETLPSAMKDPAFFRRTNMEVVDKRGRPVDPDDVDFSDTRAYRFRQRPGSSNSLGLVKFMFPNPYNVYLHDTPADALFSRETRAFSHGCVRVEDPETLADYLLGDHPEWTPDRIREAMHAAQQTTVKLRERVPVYITYFTARVSSDGQMIFFRDVYGKDGASTRR